MKVYVFGSTGMLGRYVSTYLEDIGREVVRITRADYDLSQLTYDSLKAFLWDTLGVGMGDAIINCAGLINQYGEDNSLENYFKINSHFPKYLAHWGHRQSGVHIIHASTDCVFSGKRGNYTEYDLPDAIDIYGFSKVAGEHDGVTNVRVSIIGEELKNKVSFLEFVRKNAGGKIKGYTNQIWNGITCLQWAKNTDVLMIHEHKYKTDSLIHFFSDPIPKIEIAEIINKVYDLGIDIEPVDAPKAFNKSLSTIYSKQFFTTFRMPNLYTQVEEMKEFELR